MDRTDITHGRPPARRSKWDAEETSKDSSTSSHSDRRPADREGIASHRSNLQDHRREPGSNKSSVQHQDRRRHRSRSRSPNYSSRRRSRSPLINHSDAQDQQRKQSRARDRPRSPSRSPRFPSEAQNRSPRQVRPSERSHHLVSQDKPSSSISTYNHKPSDNKELHKRSKSPEDQPPPKDEPNFNLSGKLAAETKTFKGVVLKYHEPPEARKPTKNWRLYVFKESEQIDLFHIHRQSAYLFGRDRVVVDIPIDHPSSSKQHAVVQFRQVSSTNEFGDSKTTVKPFIIDLESANGTIVNGDKIPVSRYYELQSGDVIKFGFSTREFVLIPET